MSTSHRPTTVIQHRHPYEVPLLILQAWFNLPSFSHPAFQSIIPNAIATFQKHNYAILLIKNFIDCYHVKKKIENFFIIFIFSLSGLTKLNIFLFVLVLLLKDLKFHLISDLMLSDLFVLACVSSSFINISRSLNPVNSSRRLKQWHLVDIAHS